MSDVVVCPLDGKPGAEQALSSAHDVCTALSLPLELFSAVEDAHMVDRRRTYLEQIAAAWCRPGSDPATCNVVVDPHAPHALANRSATGATLVMATSTQPLIHSGYLGSAAERVVREAPQPTMLIGPSSQTPLGSVERVVVPCDGSDLSEAALPAAQEWADRLGVELWVTTVLGAGQPMPTAVSSTAEANYVRQLAETYGAQWEVLHGDDPAKTITQWAGPALIALATHGRSGLKRIALGSVTVGVTRWSAGPVLAVHPQPATSDPATPALQISNP